MATSNKSLAAVPLLDAKGLSAQTGLSVSAIYRKRSLGESLPRAVKIGSSVRWRQADVDAWVEELLEEAP